MIAARAFASVALALMLPAAAHAAEPDGEGWVSGWATGRIAKGLLLSVDGSLRMSDRGTRAPTILVRPLIGVPVTKRLSIWGGYTYTATRPNAGGVLNEHRGVQQILWNVPMPGRSGLVSRTRMEIRSVEGRNGTGFRFREMLRFTRPIGHSKTLIVLQSEPFFNLNDAAFGQAAGFDQIRNFIGVNLPLTKGLSADLGYMNRYVARRGMEGKLDHIPSTMLIYRF